MLDKLKDAERRYMDIEGELASPDIFSDPEKYASLMKDYKGLTPIIEKFREYVCADNERSEAELLLSEPLEADMKELVLSELKESKIRMEKLFEELKVLLLPKDENDDKNVMVEIRSGAGGEEAALFAAVLYRMYTMYAESKGFKYEVLKQILVRRRYYIEECLACKSDIFHCNMRGV